MASYSHAYPAADRASAARAEVRAFKARRVRAGTAVCDVCGWGFVNGRGLAVCVAHHVVPYSCGGGYGPENLILLCPNHHATAHHLGMWTHNADGLIPGQRVWAGPQTPGQLVACIRRFESDTDPLRPNDSAGLHLRPLPAV